MATVYEVEVEVVSPWVNYTPEELEAKIIKCLEDNDELTLENINIKIKRI